LSPVPSDKPRFQGTLSKFGDHTPLYRLEDIFLRTGLEIRRSTLCGWLIKLAELARPLAMRMKYLVLQSKVRWSLFRCPVTAELKRKNEQLKQQLRGAEARAKEAAAHQAAFEELFARTLAECRNRRVSVDNIHCLLSLKARNLLAT